MLAVSAFATVGIAYLGQRVSNIIKELNIRRPLTNLPVIR